MFLSLEIDIFNKYVTNLKTTISIPQEPDNLRFAPFIIFNINFAFLKIWLIIWLDIVHIVRIMSPELQPMTVQYLCHLIQKELIWPVCKTLSIISIKNEKKMKMIIIGANLRFSGSCGISSFQIGYIFVEYNLWNTPTLIQNCIYMNLRINLVQFYINFSRQEHQIEVLYVSFNAWGSQVSFFTPFTFPLQSL